MRRLFILRAFLGIALLFCIRLWSLLKYLKNKDPVGEKQSFVPSRSPHSNKTLVVLIGNLRGGEKAWHTLYKNVLDVNQADLALVKGNTKDNSTLLARAKYVWKVHEYHDWADAMDWIQHGSKEWRNRLLPLCHPNSKLLGGIRYKGFRGSGAIIFVLRWFLSQKIIQLGLQQHYDRFVITRSDHYYKCPHNISELNMQYLWVPKGEDYGGITDRHMMVSSEQVLKALNILPPLLENPDKYADFVARRAKSPEKLIKLRWEEEGLSVQRFERMMFTCAMPGDPTRWKGLGERVPEGVHLKYRREYIASYETCGLAPPPLLAMENRSDRPKGSEN